MMTASVISHRAFSLALTGLALVFGLTACSTALKKPDVSVAEVRVAGFDPDNIQLTVTLKVHNPNPAEIGLSDLKAKFWIADTEAGELEPSQPKYVLSANSTVMLPLKINVPAKSLPTLVQRRVLALIQGGLPYRVQGSVATNNGLVTIPFDKSGEIGKRL
jgi:LEA14-like dessication related protein